MISSSDYWASVIALALLGSVAYSLRRANRQIQQDRERTVHASTVRQLGDGDRVVLSISCTGSFPFRITFGQTHRVYGFATRERVFAFVGFIIANADRLDDLDLDEFATGGGGVLLSHPSLTLRNKTRADKVTASATPRTNESETQ